MQHHRLVQNSSLLTCYRMNVADIFTIMKDWDSQQSSTELQQIIGQKLQFLYSTCPTRGIWERSLVLRKLEWLHASLAY